MSQSTNCRECTLPRGLGYRWLDGRETGVWCLDDSGQHKGSGSHLQVAIRTLRRALFIVTTVAAATYPMAASADLGAAFSGLTAKADDATSAFSSPAGIVRLDRPEVVVQTSFAYTDAKFRVDEASLGGGNADHDNEVLFVPGLFYVHPLADRWRLGLSLNVPSGIGNDYGKNWAGRYLAEESSLAFVASSAVVAWQATDKLSVGAGPYMMYTDSKTKARVNNLLPDAPDGSVRLEEDGVAFGYTLGAMYQFTGATRVAASFRSSVEPTLEGTPSFSNLDPLLRELLAAADLLGTEVDVDFKFPAIAQAGFYTELNDRWSMTGDLLWINMSEFGITRIGIEQDSITVREDSFRDSYMTTAGVTYQYRPDLAISAGAMYFTSPVSDGDRGIGLPLDRVFGVGAGVETPCASFICKVNLNYLDLGDGDLAEDSGPLTGSIEGSFSKNWALMLDFQFRRRF